jgi:four helix bundle protein
VNSECRNFGKIRHYVKLAHTRLNAFYLSRQLVLACYQLTKQLPPDEKFAMVQQIRRAALSVHLNLAEGCSRKSAAERKRFFEIDTALDIAVALEYCSQEQLQQLGQNLVNTFKTLTGMIATEVTTHN